MDDIIKLEIRGVGPYGVVSLLATLPADRAQTLYNAIAEFTRYGEVAAVNAPAEVANG